jgi:hypothetical protein
MIYPVSTLHPRHISEPDIYLSQHIVQIHTQIQIPFESEIETQFLLMIYIGRKD